MLPIGVKVGFEDGPLVGKKESRSYDGSAVGFKVQTSIWKQSILLGKYYTAGSDDGE